MFLLDQYSVVTNFTSTRIRKLVGMRRPENANTPHTTLNGLHKRRHAQLSRQLQDSLWLTEPKCNVRMLNAVTRQSPCCRLPLKLLPQTSADLAVSRHVETKSMQCTKAF